jgi:hypothetical protein
MTNAKQTKTLLAIAAIATVVAVSTIAIGNVRMALGADTTTVTKNLNNTGINVQTDTNQKQDCQTVGGTSGISGSCTATSTDTVNQTGGIKK